MKAVRRFLTIATAGLALTVSACSPPRFDDGVTVDQPQPDDQAYRGTQAETALLGGPPGSDGGRRPPPPPFPPPPPPLPPPPEDEFFEMAPIPNPTEREPRPRSHAAPARRHKDSSLAAPSASPLAKPAPRTGASRGPARPAAGSPAQKLTQGLAPEIAASRLEAPESLPKGYQGIVTLKLPSNFPRRLADEAAKAGLSVAAGATDARAVLKGEGYGISPTAPQTVRVREGQPTAFTWMVTEVGGDNAKREPLQADVGLDLKGAGEPKVVELGLVRAQAAPPAKALEPVKTQPGWRNFALTVPLLLLLLAIFAFLRWSEGRERDRRAKLDRSQPTQT